MILPLPAHLQYDGKMLAAAHEHLIRDKGLNLTHFDAVSQEACAARACAVPHLWQPGQLTSHCHLVEAHVALWWGTA
jgi:hypothetical protein